jgi:diguanylate cyclase (GGDEF)-like protein
MATPARRPLIVVADDDQVTRELLGEILRSNGYDVEVVPDGQAAVERVGKGGVDLVLLDAVMPQLSGIEACRVLKGMSVESFLPVILAAARTDPSSRVDGLKIGADDYVTKPFEEEELLLRVAGMLTLKSVHDEVAAARAKLERVSTKDELTGLYNYRYLHTRLTEEFRRAERQHEPLSACLLDIDRLRTHNERGGRATGDAILRGVAEVIKKTVRDTDVVARYGPDEFLLLLPSTHLAGSLAAGERIWREVSVRVWERSAGRVTASIGVALFPSRDVRAKDALLKSADLALSQAKRDGGNRLCVFQQQGIIHTPSLTATRPRSSPLPAPAKSAGASEAPAKSAGASEAPAKSAGASEAPAKSAGANEAPAKSAAASERPGAKKNA